jgi:aconitate hydratase
MARRSGNVPLDSFGVVRHSMIGGRAAAVVSLPDLYAKFPQARRLPFGLAILLENLLRHEDGTAVTAEHISWVADRAGRWGHSDEIAYQPSRIVMQDYSGLVALTDVATMRDEVRRAGGKPEAVRPTKPVDLIVDHSLIVNHARNQEAVDRNLTEEYEQNWERYKFLKWAQVALDGVRIVPPGNGIIHQVNLERLAQVVGRDTRGFVFPETQIGTDSHTTMINGLGVLGWGVGGIEAEAAMLGEPISMLVPDVVGVRLSGSVKPGITATDVVLTVTERLRAVGVVGRFVEFFGSGLGGLSVADRATIANMAPEYGATCGLFPIDERVIDFLRMTGRDPELVQTVEDYTKRNGLWADPQQDRDYVEVVELDLGTIGRSIAGPKRPHQRVDLAKLPATLAPNEKNEGGKLRNGDIVIASITSCTNTSNARGMITAGLLARNAVARGLNVATHIKTSLAPGSRAVVRYLDEAGLLAPLAALGFSVVGYGCATCVGNSGPLVPEVEKAVNERNLDVAAVLSGNRNFEGRIHALVRSNYLASPPLVVAYAIAGSMHVDLENDPLGADAAGRPVRLKDLWPDDQTIDQMVERHLRREAFEQTGAAMFSGGVLWDALPAQGGTTFGWDDDSTYIGPSPFVRQGKGKGAAIRDAVPLLVLGDNVTTDHISPVGAIEPDGPAAALLTSRGVARADFNAYGARRGNAEVMVRGTFANVRLQNKLVAPQEGGLTVHVPTGEVVWVHEAARRYSEAGIPVVVVAGSNYGAGSARDWAAKGTLMLGIRAVIAESFERIHRANLVLMGVLPIELDPETKSVDLAIDAESRISIEIADGRIEPRVQVDIVIEHPRRGRTVAKAKVRVDTVQEAAYFAQGGVLPFVLGKAVGATEQEGNAS